MIPALDDTIVALSSVPSGAARGVIRVSGPRMAECLANLVHPGDVLKRCGNRSEAFEAWVKLSLVDSAEYHFVPALILIWPTARSYTRQPSAELHLPGSIPLLQAALATACRSGARLAQPGEFTLRAFLAGRLDLAQAEAVLGIIQAQDERQLSVALRQLAGGIFGPLDKLHQMLLDLLADVEAGLDFVEEDIMFITTEELLDRLNTAQQLLTGILAQLGRRTLFEGSYQVVLRGLPNAGKSSLFNAMLGRSAALVSDRAGTTRDYLTADLVIDSIPIRLVDAAGTELCNLAEISDSLETAMARMTHQAAATAHLELWCVDVSLSWDEETLRTIFNNLPETSLVVWTKADLAPHSPLPQRWGGLAVSSLTGSGLQSLRQAIVQRLKEAVPHELLPVTAARCHDALREANALLKGATELARERAGDELVAGQLRAALDAVGRVTGEVFTEDLLDRIFSRFCIGK